MVFFTYHYYSIWGYILVSQKEKEALIKHHSRQRAPVERSRCTFTYVSYWRKLVFREYKYLCGSRNKAACQTLDRRGGVQDHRVVVWGRRAARDLPLQLRVVVCKSAPAFADAPTPGMAERSPCEVGKPRLLTFTGYSQAKERQEEKNNQTYKIDFLEPNTSCLSRSFLLGHLLVVFLELAVIELHLHPRPDSLCSRGNDAYHRGGGEACVMSYCKSILSGGKHLQDMYGPPLLLGRLAAVLGWEMLPPPIPESLEVTRDWILSSMAREVVKLRLGSEWPRGALSTIPRVLGRETDGDSQPNAQGGGWRWSRHTRSWKRWRLDSPSEPSRGTVALRIPWLWASGLQDHKRYISLRLSHQVCDNVLTAASRNESSFIQKG